MGKEMKKIVGAEKRLQRRLKKMERLGGRKSHEKAKDQQHKAKVKTDKDNLIVLEELSLKQRLRKVMTGDPERDIIEFQIYHFTYTKYPFHS